jgi:hypothetical protein
MAKREKLRLLLAVTEGASYGVDATPTGANALLVRDDMEIRPLDGGTVTRNVIRPFRGSYESLIANTMVGITFSVELAGSGTAGTAVRYADVLRACSLSQTITASPVTGTAQAGGAGSITLDAGESAVDDFFCGQIISLTGGTGSGESGLIVGYDGTTKVATVNAISAGFTPDATSTYSIAENEAFKPISVTDGVSDTSVTLVYNLDGVEHRITGCRGTWELTNQIGEISGIQFTMMGLYVAPADVAQSTYTVAYTNQATPLVFRNETVKGFGYFGASLCARNVSLDYGNEVVYRDLVNCTQKVYIVDGQSTGSVQVETTALATYDPFAAALTDGTTGSLGFVLGSTAGNRCSLVVPRCDLGQPTYEFDEGIAHWNLPFSALPSNTGNDDVYLVFS